MRIYVTTYAKYSSGGDLAVTRLNPEDYEDKEEFINTCYAHHCDEEFPEFLFCDFEDIPSPLVRESFVSPLIWDEYIPLTEDSRLVVLVYLENINGDEKDFNSIFNKFLGIYKSKEEYAEEYIKDCYYETLKDLPSILRDSIDYKHIASELFMELSAIEYDWSFYIFQD